MNDPFPSPSNSVFGPTPADEIRIRSERLKYIYRQGGHPQSVEIRLLQVSALQDIAASLMRLERLLREKE